MARTIPKCPRKYLPDDWETDSSNESLFLSSFTPSSSSSAASRSSSSNSSPINEEDYIRFLERQKTLQEETHRSQFDESQEEPHGRSLDEKLGKPSEESLGRPQEEPVCKLPEEKPLNEPTDLLLSGENFENVDPNIHAPENKTPQKKRSLSQSTSQEACQDYVSKRETKRQRRISKRNAKSAEREIFPVHVCSAESPCHGSNVKAAKRKLTSSASENESESKKQPKHTFEDSDALDENHTTSLENNESKYDEPSTSKGKLDKSCNPCDNPSLLLASMSLEDSCERRSERVESDKRLPEETAPTSTKQPSESDPQSCSSQEVAESDELHFKAVYEDSNNVSADDEADDVQKLYFLSNAFVRKHKNMKEASKESSDSTVSAEEFVSTSTVQPSKNDLNPFQSLKMRKKKLDREKSSEDPAYPVKIKYLRKWMKQMLPKTKPKKRHRRKLLKRTSESKSSGPDTDRSFTKKVSSKTHKIENSSNETSESEKSSRSDSDGIPKNPFSRKAHKNKKSSNKSLECQESSDDTLINRSNEENSDDDQCVPKTTLTKQLARRVHKNQDNSPNKSSATQQTSDKDLTKFSDEENFDEDQCVPESSPIKTSEAKSPSPNTSPINIMPRMVQKNENYLSNQTLATQQTSDKDLVNLSNENNLEEEQCVPEGKENTTDKEMDINEIELQTDSSNDICKPEYPSRREALQKVIRKYSFLNHPWKDRVFAGIKKQYPDLIFDEPDPAPGPSEVHATDNEYYVDNPENTLELAAEACVAEAKMVDERDDQLYCRKPQPCPSPTNPSADDELSDESEDEMSYN